MENLHLPIATAQVLRSLLEEAEADRAAGGDGGFWAVSGAQILAGERGRADSFSRR